MTTESKPSRTRIISSNILVVLGVLLLVVSVLANFVKREALDSSSFKSTSRALIADPKIQTALASTMTDQLFANVDVTSTLQARLPPILQPLAGPIAGGVHELVPQAAEQILQRPKAQELFVQASGRAQQQVVKVLEGNGKTLQTTNGVVVLDLRPLVIALGDRFNLLKNLTTQIPVGATQITIMRSNDLKTVQDITQALKVVADWIWVFAILAWAGAIWLVPGRRRETVRAIAIGFIVAGLIVVIVRSLASTYIVNHLVVSDTVRLAADDAVSIVTRTLAAAGWTVFAVGVIALAGALLAGEGRRETAARRALAPYLARAGLAYAGLFVAFLLFVWWSPLLGLRNILILAVLAIVGFEVFRRQTAREFPQAAPAVAAAFPPPRRRLRPVTAKGAPDRGRHEILPLFTRLKVCKVSTDDVIAAVVLEKDHRRRICAWCAGGVLSLESGRFGGKRR